MHRGDDPGPDERGRNAGGLEPTTPRSGVTARRVIIAVAAIALIAFAIANFERVDVSFLVFETQARVVTVIAVAGILGFVIGYLVGRPSREQRKRLSRLDDD